MHCRIPTTFFIVILAGFLCGCSPKEPVPAAVPVAQTSQNEAGPIKEDEMLKKFVPDEVVNPFTADSEVGRFAARVFEIGSEFETPNDVTKALGLDALVWRNYHVGKQDGPFLKAVKEALPGWPSWEVEVNGVKLTLTMQLKPGTWEPPMGNSMPRIAPPKVVGVLLTGPGYLSLDTPESARQVLFDYEDKTQRQMKTWGKYVYFEQGHSGREWMVANLTNRGPFHTIGAQRKTVEALMITLADAVLAGETDIQMLLKKHAAEYEVAPNRYDFESAVFESTAPPYMTVRWTAPSKIPRFFKHLDVNLLMTGFAHNFGEVSSPVELKGFKLEGLDYYIDEPFSRTAEMGSAKDAYFRGVNFRLDRKN